MARPRHGASKTSQTEQTEHDPGHDDGDESLPSDTPGGPEARLADFLSQSVKPTALGEATSKTLQLADPAQSTLTYPKKLAFRVTNSTTAAVVLTSLRRGRRERRRAFHDVYILVSETDDRFHYGGITDDLNARVAEHNRGKCPCIET
jgi:hypothetical protein